MKIKLVAITLLMVGLCWNSCTAQQWRAERYDPRWLPITDAEMRKQVRANARDAVALYRLYDRARYQYKEQPYFSALRKLTQEQPKNGAVLSMYCAVLMRSNVLYGFGQFRFQVDADEGGVENISRNLEKAKKLAPKLWLNPITEAYLTLFNGAGDDRERGQNAVALCRYAVRLAPHLSYTNKELGYALVNLTTYNKKAGFSEAVRYYKKAQSLSPANCDASFLLLNVYRFEVPNKTEAAKAAKAVLATIPPNVKLSEKLRQFLAKQGVTVPKA